MLAALLPDASLLLSVHVRFCPGTSPGYSLYLATMVPPFRQPVRLSNIIGMDLYYHYGITGFLLPKDLKLKILHNLFSTARSHKSICPEEWEEKGVRLFFHHSDPIFMKPPRGFENVLRNRFKMSECSIDLCASQEDLLEFFNAVRDGQFLDLDALPAKQIFPIFGRESY